MRIFINKIPFLLFIFFLNIFCYGQGTFNICKDKNSNQTLLKLNISINKEIIQTIDYAYSEESIENGIFVEDEFELIDVNFDGIKDLLVYLGNFGNQGVVYKDCFIWNNDIKMFENYSLFKNIQNPQIDENEKCIYGNSRNNSGHYEFELYTWDEKDLKCDFKIHKVYSALQLADLYKIDIPENRDSGEYMLEYFNIDKTLYDSVFYVKICYDKGEIKISEPSSEIFYRLPEKLKALLSK